MLMNEELMAGRCGYIYCTVVTGWKACMASRGRMWEDCMDDKYLKIQEGLKSYRAWLISGVREWLLDGW